MPVSTATIHTTQGTYEADIVTPAGSGPWPAVILFFDAAGRRPAMTAIAERIARDGYLVAIPDLFHRSGDVRKILPEGASLENGVTRAIFADDGAKKRFFAEFYGPALRYENLEVDVQPLLAHLDGRADVKPGPVGTTGYCMGGNASLRVATLFGDAIGVTTCFHAGGLATDAPDSPHLRLGSVRSTVYVAGAANDASFTDAAKETLEAALQKAGVAHFVETYPAAHGFAVPDHAGAYDPAAAERHYEALTKLFGAKLR